MSVRFLIISFNPTCILTQSQYRTSFWEQERYKSLYYGYYSHSLNCFNNFSEFGVKFHSVYANCPRQILCVFWAREAVLPVKAFQCSSARWPRKTKEVTAEQAQFPPVVLHNPLLDKGHSSRPDTGSSLYCRSRGLHSRHGIKTSRDFFSLEPVC